jgi:ribosomal protein S18 acetylase RimI-like enzyme
MDDVRVRVADLPADADALAAVYISSAAHHAGLDPDFYQVPTREAVADRYRDPSHLREAVILVAEVGGVVVGMATVRMLPPTSEASMVTPARAASVDVALLGAYRGRGIGERLMRSAEAAARIGGADRVVLDVAAANERALRFYQDRLGYRMFGALLMKPLTDEEAPS